MRFQATAHLIVVILLFFNENNPNILTLDYKMGGETSTFKIFSPEDKHTDLQM